MRMPICVRIHVTLLVFALAVGIAPAAMAAELFYTVPPCRVLDTRTPADAPALLGQQERVIQVTGLCGIPAEATAVSANITVTEGTAGGSLLMGADGTTLRPDADIRLPFQPNQTRANNGLVQLSADGKVKTLALTGETQTVHLILDVNGYFAEVQNQPATVGGGPFSLAENSANGTVVGTATATDPDVGQTHTFAITAGNTGGAFAIDASTGEITVAASAALDFETTPTFNLTVQATDNGTPPVSGTGTVVVNLTDVNEAPEPSGGPFTIAESSANGAAVGTVAHGDPDAGQTHTFAITAGNTGGVFAIDGSTGAITVANSALLDAEGTPSYSLTVEVTDDGTPPLTGSTTVVVNVTDDNETPAPAGGPFTLAENSANGTVVGTVTVTDPDAGQTHTFAITAGNTGGAFAINPTSGQITVANSAAVDFETTPTFNLTVQATDNGTPPLSGTTIVVVNLTDVNEAPAPTGGPFSVAENSANGTVVGTVAHNDPDAGQTRTFAITAGNTSGAFAINTSTGEITVANSAALDFDVTPTFNLTVEVTDDGTPPLTGSTTVVINLTNENEAPAPTGGPFSVAENSANGTIVGTVAHNDPDAGQTHTFAITAGNALGAFAIDPSTGQITVADSADLNFEVNPTFSLTVEVTDNGTPPLTGSTMVVINLTDVNEPPAPTGGPFSLAENSANGTIVGTVAHNDPDAGQTRTFAITAGNTGGAFAINPSTGQITVASSAALNFETTPTFNLTVEVTDDGTPPLTGSTTVVVNLTNVNETPAPAGGPFSVPENSANGTSVGTVTVTDPDVGQTHTFAITGGNTGGAFAINLSTGEITVANSAALNFETTPTFSLTVEATDNGTPPLTGSTTVDVNLTDVNEPPAPTGGPFSLAENSANGTIVGTVAHNDPDAGQTRTFAITAGNTGGAFAINPSTGQITVADSTDLNFETTPTFNLTVEVTDNGTPALTGSTTVVINLTNVNETPTDMAIDNALINENQPAGTAVGNFSTTDPDSGDTFTYTLVDTASFPDNAAFTIVGNQLRSAVIFNFEVKNSYSIRVRSTDAGGLFVEKTFTITIVDVPEPPVPDPDAFDFIGNTELQVDPVTESSTPHALELTMGLPTFGVLDGDTDPDVVVPDDDTDLRVSQIVGCGDTTAPYTCPTANGGTVVMEDTGRFSFTPKVGDTAATDSFQYEVRDTTNLTATALVTLTRFRQAWYVNNNATGGTGLSNDPFGALASVPPVSVADDYIFVHFGDGTSTDQNAGIVLKNGQHLIGQHAGFSIPISINGNPSPTSLFSATPGSRPLIGNAGGNGVAATDAIPAEILGLNLAGSVDAIKLLTNGPFPGSGTLEIKNNVFRGAGGEGIEADAAGSGTLTLDVQGNTWSAGTHAGNAVDIARTGGTLRVNFSGNTGIRSNLAGVVINGGAVANTTITGFANNTVHESTGGTGIMVSNATFDSNTAAANLQAVGGGNTSIGIPTDAVGGAGLVLSAVTGALDFTDLDVFAGAGAGGAGVSITGTGAFTGAAGTRLTVTADAGIVESTGGPAVDANNATIDLRLTSIKVNSSPTTGVSLVNVSDASVAPLAAQFSAGTGSSIANTTGTDFNVDGGNATVSYAGSITNSAGRSVSVINRTGDSVTFTSGTINDTGTGIQVNSNAAGAVTDFLGTLTLSTGANAAFNASSGGTLRVMGAANTVATTTGTALNVTNTTIGAGSGAPETGLRFRSISAGTPGTGPTNGIVLNNTGASGSLTVTGTGGAGTGGTIRRAGTGISLTNTRNVSLASLQMNDFTDFAIRGTSVVGFTLSDSTVNGTSGDSSAADEGCVRFTELTGSAAISNSSFSGSVEDTFSVVNSTGTLDRITFSNTTFGLNHNSTGDNGLKVVGSGSAVVKTTIQNSFFTGARGDHMDATLAAGSTGSLDVAFTGNTVSDNHPSIVAGGGGMLIGGVAGTVTYNVSGTNTFRDATGDALVISCGGTGSVCTGRIEGAQIGLQAVANSGSSGGSGIALVSAVGGSFTALLNNNVIRQYNNHGIRMQAGDLMGNPLTYNVTVTNNTVGNAGTINTDFNGIHLNNGTVATDSFTTCADIRNNSIAGSGKGAVAPNNADYRLRQRQSTTVRLPGYGGANNNDAAVVAFVSGNQTTVSTGAASNTVATGGGGFVGGASCPTPP